MKPPFSITPDILASTSVIERFLGKLEGLNQPKPQPFLRRSNRVRTIQGSLAIEGNTLTIEQVTDILDGKRVIAPKQDILEVKNAISVYDRLKEFKPFSIRDLLRAHGFLMKGLISNAGKWRQRNFGILKGSDISHVAPKANRIAALMRALFGFLKAKDTHPLIKAGIFHYELEFIHPFEDGNGRIGRFWHSLLLYHYHPVFEFIPVESLIRENQSEYYRALEQSDNSGHSTPFIEFSLMTLQKAFIDFIDELKPETSNASSRLEIAANHFGSKQFTRKDYLNIFKTISTATASRDLRFAVDNKRVEKKGDKSKAKYRFTNFSNSYVR